MIISLIVAASENDVIGINGKLPWSLPDDLRHFREITRGKIAIMGRKTYESIGRPLPDRRNIVISTSRNNIEGCEVYSSLGEALLKLALELKESPKEEIFVIGGSQLFSDFMLKTFTDFTADKIYLTRIHANINGDTFFPKIDSSQWYIASKEDHLKDDAHEYAFTFITYERKH